MTEDLKKPRKRRRKPQKRGKRPAAAKKKAVVVEKVSERELVTEDRGIGPPPVKGKPPGEDGASFDFADFFLKVGQGLVEAQKKMDAASLAYLQETSAQPHVLPSIFRIPKLSANVKFALTQATDKSVGIIFYKDETKAETLNQQSVAFDIVSVPAPSQLKAPLSVSLVFSALQRKEILDKLEAYRISGDSTGALTETQLGIKTALQNRDRIMIYAATVDGFFLTFADENKDENVGLWYVTLTDPLGVSVLHKFGDTTGANLRLVRELVLRQGNQQADFLKQKP